MRHSLPDSAIKWNLNGKQQLVAFMTERNFRLRVSSILFDNVNQSYMGQSAKLS